MKVIIPLAGYGTRMRPHAWSRPKALLNLAGDTVLGHLLHQLRYVIDDTVIFVVGYKRAEIETWVRHHYPHLNAEFVVQEEALGQAHAIWLCRRFLDDGELLIAFGDGIVGYDYRTLSTSNAEGVCLVEEVEDPRLFGVVAVDEQGFIKRFVEKPSDDAHRLAIAGIYWFRRGRDLGQALDRLMAQERPPQTEIYLADAYQLLLAAGFRLSAVPALFWLDAGNKANVLTTNARLLGMGYSSADVVERSYAEDFTVMPPVYLHESAVVEAAVIGPYVSIAAGATLRRCILRNTIVEAAAHIEDCLLDDSLIGERVRVSGSGHTLVAGDDSIISLDSR